MYIVTANTPLYPGEMAGRPVRPGSERSTK